MTGRGSARAALALCIAATLGVTACSKAKRDSIVFANQGIEQYRHGAWQAARGYFEQSLGLDPDNGNAHYHLGLIALYDEPKPDVARPHLLRAQELDPSDPEVAYHLGRLELEHGAKDKARQHLADATARDPNHAGAWHTRGRLERAEGKLVEADKAWREALAIDPTRTETYMDLSAMYDELDYVEEARAVLEAGVERSEKQADLLNALGVFELRDGKAARAVELLGKAVAIQPDRLDALYNLAFALHENKEPDRALHVLGALIANGNREYKEQVEMAKALRQAMLRERMP